MRRSGIATITALFALAAAAGTAAVHAQSVKPLRWIINGPALQTFTTDPSAVRFFAGTRPFVIEGKHEDGVTPPAAWNAIRVQVYPSYASMARAFADNTVPAGVGAVLYDNEAWQFTPADEQKNFAQYNQKAAALVHSHGLLFISTPAVDLVRVLAPGTRGRRYQQFLQLNIPADAARYADVVDIQAQGSEMATSKFAGFVRAAANQARSANPKVLVFAGISTNPSGHHVDSDEILRAINATRGAVDGYWFNVPQPSAYCPDCNDFRPDMAIDVLKRLGAF